MLKFEKREAASDPLEQSDIRNIHNGEEQIENQVTEEYKTEESVHKELKDDVASDGELRESQESNTEICGKEINICEKSEGEQQKSEQNKEESGEMIKDIKQCEEYDRKDNNSGVSRNSPAGKYWSPEHSEDVPLQRPQDVP